MLWQKRRHVNESRGVDGILKIAIENRYYTNNPMACASFQNQVFLEDRDCARLMLKNQALRRVVPRWVLERCGFDAVAAMFATVTFFRCARHSRANRTDVGI
jgi:hypothetical protein